MTSKNMIDEAMIYETKRLYARKMDMNDMPELKKILQDKSVMYAYEHAFNDAEVLEWMNRQLDRYKKFGYGLWALILKDTGEMIGQCGLSMQGFLIGRLCFPMMNMHV